MRLTTRQVLAWPDPIPATDRVASRNWDYHYDHDDGSWWISHATAPEERDPIAGNPVDDLGSNGPFRVTAPDGTIRTVALPPQPRVGTVVVAHGNMWLHASPDEQHRDRGWTRNGGDSFTTWDTLLHTARQVVVKTPPPPAHDLDGVPRPGVLAERYWWVRARVRVLSDQPQTGLVAGQEAVLQQWGLRDRHVSEHGLWYVEPGSFCVPAYQVRVLETLESHPATWEDAALDPDTAARLLSRHHDDAEQIVAAWLAAGYHLALEQDGLVVRQTGHGWRRLGIQRLESTDPQPYEAVVFDNDDPSLRQTRPTHALPFDPLMAARAHVVAEAASAEKGHR